MRTRLRNGGEQWKKGGEGKKEWVFNNSKLHVLGVLYFESRNAHLSNGRNGIHFRWHARRLPLLSVNPFPPSWSHDTTGNAIIRILPRGKRVGARERLEIRRDTERYTLLDFVYTRSPYSIYVTHMDGGNWYISVEMYINNVLYSMNLTRDKRTFIVVLRRPWERILFSLLNRNDKCLFFSRCIVFFNLFLKICSALSTFVNPKNRRYFPNTSCISSSIR